jgi:hypothetical protein
MKRLTLLLAIMIAFMSCSNNNNNSEIEIVGEWKLIETLADPGDGSGTFQPINSDKIIEFFNDETFTSNGTLCQMSDETTTTTGTYSETESEIFPTDCINPELSLSFEITNSRLIISYFCIEPCKEKYVKVNF